MDWKDPVKRREYYKKYYLENKLKIKQRSNDYRSNKENAEKEKARNKKYYQKNKEKISLQKKKYREENAEKEKARNKNYYQNNKEKTRAHAKKWAEDNPILNHKSRTKWKWKSRGLILDDPDEFESIYYLVMSTENCDGCKCKLTENKPQTSTSRCMDHDHFTGKFRAVLCKACNVKQPKQIKNNINIDEII